MSTFTPIYLDANATTRALEPVIEEMLQVMRSGAANPASARETRVVWLLLFGSKQRSSQMENACKDTLTLCCLAADRPA
jgi:hypothetical protein